MKLLLLLLLTAISLPLLGDSISDERLWTGKNGKSFRGIFIRVLENETKAEIASNSGKVFTIDIDNLCAGDRLLIRGALDDAKEPAGKDPKKEGAKNEGIKEVPVTDRGTMIPIRPMAVDSRESDELLDPLWQFVAWWDNRGILPIPKKGDDKKRMEWAHERLARFCKARSGSRVIRAREAKEGLEKYFAEELSDTATVAVHLDTDFSPAMLERYCDGVNAVVLSMTMRYRQAGKSYRACAALESIDTKGNAIVHMWGKRKEARFVLKEARPPGGYGQRGVLSRANSSFEIILNNLDGLPDHIAAQSPSFVVDPEQQDTVLIAKPYVFSVTGQRRRPPADPLFERRPDRPNQVAKIPAPIAVQLPIDFSSGFGDERTWTFDDGSTFTGKLDFDDRLKAILRDPRGRTKEFQVDSLSPEDQACYYFALGGHGHGATPPRLELNYQLRSQNGGTYDFVISTRGTLGRVDCKQTYRTLIFDTKDSSYHCWKGESYRYWGRWRGPTRGRSGLIPSLSRPDRDEAEKNAAFGEIVKLARKANDFEYPSRYAQFSLNGETFKHPKVDFTVMQDPTATVAIYQLLNTSAPASYDQNNPKDPLRKQTIVFSNATEVGCHRGLHDIAHRFTQYHILPLRMRWSNDVNTSWVDRENQIKTSGIFELALTGARVPASFPDDHFSIPEAARKAEVGTCLTPTK